MTKTKKFFRVLIPAAGLLLMLTAPKLVSGAIADGVDLCVRLLLPSLFPYMVVSALLVQGISSSADGRRSVPLFLRKLGLSRQGGTVLLIGFLAGYPTGAKTIADLYKNGALSKKEAQRLLAFACNSGPAFIFGVLGALYRSTALCIWLFCIHLGTALLIGFLLPGKESTSPQRMTETAKKDGFSNGFIQAVGSASEAMVRIGGLVCLFSVVIALENAAAGDYKNIFPCLAALTELTGGVRAIAQSSMSWTLRIMLTAAAVSFGGFCVMLQTASVLSETDLSLQSYLAGKCLQALLSALAAAPVSILISPTVPASTLPVSGIQFSPWPWMLFSAAVYIVIFLQFPTGNFPKHRV